MIIDPLYEPEALAATCPAVTPRSLRNMTKSHRSYRFRPPRQTGELSAEYAERTRQWRYEEACVKHILDRVKLSDLRQELWKEHKRNDGDDFGRLTLDDFQRRTGFPLWLGSRHLKWGGQLSIKSVLRDFESTPMYRAVCEVGHAIPLHFADRSFGVIFPVPKLKFMALHTLASDSWGGATRIVLPTSRHGLTFHMERLDDLLDVVGPPESWQICSQELNRHPRCT
jgi:hypothetical protein